MRLTGNALAEAGSALEGDDVSVVFLLHGDEVVKRGPEGSDRAELAVNGLLVKLDYAVQPSDGFIKFLAGTVDTLGTVARLEAAGWRPEARFEQPLLTRARQHRAINRCARV